MSSAPTVRSPRLFSHASSFPLCCLWTAFSPVCCLQTVSCSRQQPYCAVFILSDVNFAYHLQLFYLRRMSTSSLPVYLCSLFYSAVSISTLYPPLQLRPSDVSILNHVLIGYCPSPLSLVCILLQSAKPFPCLQLVSYSNKPPPSPVCSLYPTLVSYPSLVCSLSPTPVNYPPLTLACILRLDRSTARQIYGSIHLQRKQNFTSRSINPCSKGKMSL